MDNVLHPSGLGQVFGKFQNALILILRDLPPKCWKMAFVAPKLHCLTEVKETLE